MTKSGCDIQESHCRQHSFCFYSITIHPCEGRRLSLPEEEEDFAPTSRSIAWELIPFLGALSWWGLNLIMAGSINSLRI